MEVRPTFWHGVSDRRSSGFLSSPIRMYKSQGNALKLLIWIFGVTQGWFDLIVVQVCGKVARRVGGGEDKAGGISYGSSP